MHVLSKLFETPVSIRSSLGVPVCLDNGKPALWLLHLYSGRRRIGDCHWWLQHIGAKLLPEYDLKLISVDTAIDRVHGDLSSGPNLQKILRMARQGLFAAVLTGPPCETFSAARGIALESGFGPRILRTREQPWLLPERGSRELRQCDVGSELLLNSLQIETRVLCSGGGALMEHPWEPADEDKISVWRLDCHQRWCMRLRDAYRHYIEQWTYGAAGVKPTCMRALQLGPPSVIAQALHDGVELWRPKPAQGLKGRKSTGEFHTAKAKEYPSALCRSLVVAILRGLRYRIAHEGVKEPITPTTEDMVWVSLMLDKAEVLALKSYLPDFQGAVQLVISNMNTGCSVSTMAIELTCQDSKPSAPQNAFQTVVNCQNMNPTEADSVSIKGGDSCGKLTYTQHFAAGDSVSAGSGSVEIKPGQVANITCVLLPFPIGNSAKKPVARDHFAISSDVQLDFSAKHLDSATKRLTGGSQSVSIGTVKFSQDLQKVTSASCAQAVDALFDWKLSLTDSSQNVHNLLWTSQPKEPSQWAAPSLNLKSLPSKFTTSMKDLGFYDLQPSISKAICGTSLMNFADKVKLQVEQLPKDSKVPEKHEEVVKMIVDATQLPKCNEIKVEVKYTIPNQSPRYVDLVLPVDNPIVPDTPEQPVDPDQPVEPEKGKDSDSKDQPEEPKEPKDQPEEEGDIGLRTPHGILGHPHRWFDGFGCGQLPVPKAFVDPSKCSCSTLSPVLERCGSDGTLEKKIAVAAIYTWQGITAFQMGGLDQALRLFGEWIDSQKVEESQEVPEEEEHEEVAPETLRETLRDTQRGSRVTGLFEARPSTRESRHTVVEDVPSEPESDRPSRPSGDPDDFRLEDLELEVVQVIDESGKRLSKFAMSQSDLQRLQEGSSKPSSDDLLDPYYFSHVQGDINEILSIRSAESAILLLKKRYFVLRQQDIAMDLAHSARSAAELRRDLDRCPELWDLFRAKFDCMKYNGKVPVQDLDLYFCTLVYGSKHAFTSIHALWDKFEVGEKGYMTKDEWYNLCTRVQTKLPKHAQLDIWNLLAWRDKVHLHKPDFVAGWHVHDLEVRDAHVKSVAGNLQLEYYGIKVEELQERIRMRLAEDSQVGSQSRSKDALVALPMGDGERWMKRSDKNQGRGKKRQREEAEASQPESVEEGIMKGRYEKQRLPSIGRMDLLAMVNGDLAPGEPAFTEAELDAGLAKMETANKIMIDEAGDEVIFVG
eukprot:s432_g11.t1